MKKSILACCLVLVASAACAETVVEQTVIIQRDTELTSFSVITDKRAVEAMVKEYPQGLEIGTVTHEFACAKNHGAFTNFIPGKCEDEAKR